MHDPDTSPQPAHSSLRPAASGLQPAACRLPLAASGLFSLFCVASCLASLASAGDWPQILGPHRNGQAENESLLTSWPADGPAVLWRHPIGAGFAGPAVVGQEVYVFHRVGEFERLEMLNAATGQVAWKADVSASYQGGINPDNGPRCVPLVHGENVYVFGAAGDLHCVARSSGSKKWSRATRTEFQAAEGYFGFGSAPIVVGQVLMANVGGVPDAGIVAFSLETGETVWKATKEQASYAAPTQTVLDGKLHAVFVTRYNALAIDPDTGAVRFQFPFGKRGPTVNAATPLVFDNQLFLSSNYGIGSVLAKIDGVKPEVVWSGDESLSSQYNTAVCFRDHLYGIHGREDVGRAELRCVEARTGKVAWSVPGFGVAHLILADDKLLVLKVDGTLLLADPNPTRFTQLAEARASRNTTRALPALSAGHFYFRDSGGEQGTLTCLVVGN
jgi:outer membrane protein assembly factor BamB